MSKSNGGRIPDNSELIKHIHNFKNAKADIDSLLDLLIEGDVYDKLSTEDKVKHDLFVSYSLTSLFWMYLRTQGVNSAEHSVKTEIERVLEYAKKYKRVKERKAAPQLNLPVANRFIKHGVWNPKQKLPESNKRKKLDED